MRDEVGLLIAAGLLAQQIVHAVDLLLPAVQSALSESITWLPAPACAGDDERYRTPKIWGAAAGAAADGVSAAGGGWLVGDTCALPCSRRRNICCLCLFNFACVIVGPHGF